MKRDFDIKSRNEEAKRSYDRIVKARAQGLDTAPPPDTGPETTIKETCSGCGKGNVTIDVSKDPDWTFIMEHATCINIGGHSLQFTCTQCGGHISRRAVENCKSNYPKYKP